MGLRYKKAPAIEVYFGIKKLPYTLGWYAVVLMLCYFLLRYSLLSWKKKNYIEKNFSI
jgi:hypothetical protein